MAVAPGGRPVAAVERASAVPEHRGAAQRAGEQPPADGHVDLWPVAAVVGLVPAGQRAAAQLDQRVAGALR
ncbi:MAG: hypothetical protein ACRDWI_07630, partial [Jiangellaceae bacterium]